MSNRDTTWGRTPLFAMMVTALLSSAALGSPQGATAPPDTSIGDADKTGDRVAPPSRPGTKRDKRAPHDPNGTDLRPDDSDSNAARKIAKEESKLEKRKAKIARLRELAKEQGNEQRLRALDDLERRTIEGHERKVAKWRERLGEDRFKRVKEKVKKKGDKRAKGAGKDRDHAEGKDGDKDHKGSRDGEHGAKDGDRDAHGKGKNRDRGAAAGSGAGKPEDPRGQKEAKGKGPGKSKKSKGDKP